jgi:hypothetical protein
MEKVWPRHLFCWQEEAALHYLLLKGFDVYLALTAALYNQDQLIQLLIRK